MVYIKPVSKKTGWKAGETLPTPRCTSSGYRHPLSPCWSESPTGNAIWKGTSWFDWAACVKLSEEKKKKQGREVGGIDKRSKKRYWKFTLATICGLVRAASFRKPLPDSKRVVPPYLNALRFLSSLGRPKFPWHSQLPRPPFHVAMPQASSSARGLVGEPRTWGYGHRGMWRWVGSELVSQTW